ncbi:hypothetical protein Fmac_028415 [Flemingia macrophylla]|uniref:Uncharacterized protein n=1 Tax=Flemingia macrophylla TaxID=520843 RepID=A0ABD1L7G3_9FABA
MTQSVNIGLKICKILVLCMVTFTVAKCLTDWDLQLAPITSPYRNSHPFYYGGVGISPPSYGMVSQFGSLIPYAGIQYDYSLYTMPLQYTVHCLCSHLLLRMSGLILMDSGKIASIGLVNNNKTQVRLGHHPRPAPLLPRRQYRCSAPPRHEYHRLGYHPRQQYHLLEAGVQQPMFGYPAEPRVINTILSGQIRERPLCPLRLRTRFFNLDARPRRFRGESASQTFWTRRHSLPEECLCFVGPNPQSSSRPYHIGSPLQPLRNFFACLRGASASKPLPLSSHSTTFVK